MKKRALSLLLALVMIFGLLPVTARAATLDNGLAYKVYDAYDGERVRITAYTGTASELVIPTEIEGKPVTAIANEAFSGCVSLTSIELPDSLTYIGNRAFYDCKKLTSISIPEGVSQIDSYTFSGCSSLTSINLPSSVTSIGAFAFRNCYGLTSISIPEGVVSISIDAFCECENLTSIDLPDSLTSIGDSAFIECHSLTSISIPEGVTSIGGHTFFWCDSLKSVSIPEGVTSIGEYAFGACYELTNITIPGSVTMIDTKAFYHCDNLSSIYFKGDAPWIEKDVFSSSILADAVAATAYYPVGNPTWTADVMQDYGGDITWVPYNPSNPFTDVPLGAYYEEPVIWAVENSITDGTSDTTFSPDDQCLRSQVVTFLHRAAKNPAPSSAKNPFSDVKTGDYFYKPVLWAVEKGITDGVADDLFGSKAVCTRGQVVTFLWRAAGEPMPKSTENPFEDVKAGDYFYTPVLWAVENGITDGVDDTHFAPSAPCTRAQVVTFLYRADNESR